MEKLIIKAIQNIEDKFKNDILAIYPYGSVVYKNKKPEDIDLIVVFNTEVEEKKSFYIDDYLVEINCYSKNDFLKKLQDHDISVLECIYIEHEYKFESDDLKKEILNFKIDKHKLREASSKKSSNSYVKALKKIIIEKDYNPYISLKSLWHSFRILDFSIQIAKENKIVNPKKMNYLFEEIKEDYEIFENNWEYINFKYKKKYKKLHSDFKKECPKNIQENKP